MSVQEQLERLERVRELELEQQRLEADRSALEVEVIVHRSSGEGPPAGMNLTQEKAARIVDALERAQRLRERLRPKDPSRIKGELRSVQEALCALADWQGAGRQQGSGTVQRMLPWFLLCVVSTVAWAAWTFHPILLVILVPVLGAASFVTGTGYDAQFKRAGAQRRFDATALARPSSWEPAAVEARVAALRLELASLEQRAAAEAQRPELEGEEREALEAELESAELALFSVCAQAGIDPQDVDAERLDELRIFSAPVRVDRDLKRVGRELKDVRREADALREEVFRFLSRAGAAPRDGRADVESLAGALAALDKG